MKAKKAKIKKDREMYEDCMKVSDVYIDDDVENNPDRLALANLTLEELDAGIEEMEIEMYGKRISPPLEELKKEIRANAHKYKRPSYSNVKD
ncbi:MAG: hypothetical protein RR988_03820 [Clostridia bacterium]